MKEEYDFSNGERGKFYLQDVKFNLPIYLDADNLLFLRKIAEKKQSDISTLVNELLRSDRKIVELMD